MKAVVQNFFLVLGTWCRTRGSSFLWEDVYQRDFYVGHSGFFQASTSSCPAGHQTKQLLRNHLRGTTLVWGKRNDSKGCVWESAWCRAS